MVVDIIWWLVPCGVLGPIINPGGIRQAWLGGTSFLCNPPCSFPPMPETPLGCRNHAFVSDLVFRWDWAICRNSACHNGCWLGLLWSNFCMMYWAMERWLRFKIWKGSCRLTWHNSSWLQFDRLEVRGKMVKCPAVTIRGLKRRMGTNVLMYLKNQARGVLNGYGNSCWKVLVQAKCGNNLAHLIRLYVIWVKTKHCSKWLVTSINYGWRFMDRVGAATLTKDQLQSTARVCCLWSKAMQLLKAYGRFLLGLKPRSTVKYVGQGTMSMLQGPGLVGIYSGCFGPGYNTATSGGPVNQPDSPVMRPSTNTLELKTQVVGYWAVFRLICGYGIIITKENFGMLGVNVGHHFIGWRRIQVNTKVRLRDTDFCGLPPGYGPPCIYSKDSVRFVTHCKARALCIPRVGVMVSYFWSPKHVLGDGKGGMPPLKV
ncbi:hypothetical protein Hanom_Chr13g01182371 [Helianthus anomalus]